MEEERQIGEEVGNVTDGSSKETTRALKNDEKYSIESGVGHAPN